MRPAYCSRDENTCEEVMKDCSSQDATRTGGVDSCRGIVMKDAEDTDKCDDDISEWPQVDYALFVRRGLMDGSRNID